MHAVVQGGPELTRQIMKIPSQPDAKVLKLRFFEVPEARSHLAWGESPAEYDGVVRSVNAPGFSC